MTTVSSHADLTPKGRRVRATIIEAAARLMHERGVATGLSDVLSASAAGKSQFYHYFSSKQDLTVAVFEYQLERLLAGQPSLTDETCVDPRRWRNEVVSAFNRSAVGTCPLGTFAGQVGADPELGDALRSQFERWQTGIADLIRRAAAASRLPADIDADAAALMLLAAQQGGTVLAQLHGDAAPLSLALDGALREIGCSV
jgi:TetR/AcrR family transcriptional regulator, transcriptional repressor for nem operon